MRRLVPISLLLLMSAGLGCTYHPDLKKDFQMSLDGSKFVWESAPAVAYIYGGPESVLERPATIRIILPNLGPSRHPLPGMEIMFDEDVFADSNQVTASGKSHEISVDLRPSFRPMGKGGMLVGYTSHDPRATVTVRISKLDARSYGSVEGKIIYAKLWGYYYDFESGEITQPPQPMMLEIWNWPFGAKLEQKYPGDE
ncbi:hypothetical protein HZA73_08270 [candidate division TA06 bacterium]|nr:hypothetical protein [candidate division TA06 bacterium]